MPNPQEYAELRVNGWKFRDWTSLQVEKDFSNPVTAATFTAASPIEAGTWAGQKLKVGDQFEAYLAGVKVSQGPIALRQVAYDAKQHALMLKALSLVSDLNYNTVEPSAGYQNKTLAQIGSDLTKSSGIKFSIEGNPAGADKPFARFHPEPGEPVMNALARICRMRNLFLIDDENGNLKAKRLEETKSETVHHLEEGRNILSATCVMSDENPWKKIQATGSQPGNDQRWGDQARTSSSSVENAAPSRGGRILIIRAEEPGDDRDMQMRAEHEAALVRATMLQAQITVQGWHDPSGKLWIKSVGEQVTVKSPMLFPDKMSLFVQGVTHTQSAAGTLTVLNLVMPGRQLANGRIEATAGAPEKASFKSAKADAPDVTTT
ncbi:prophage tail gpP-like protein [Bosea sp. OAE752]|uniref:hypothetical protein n=1 Tax=Bosea sp. OAE752 TaxID=2663873 RepID=UPI003D23E644